MSYRFFLLPVLFAVLFVGLAGCGGESAAPGDTENAEEAFLDDVRTDAATTGSETEPDTAANPAARPQIALETDVYEMGTIPGGDIAVERMKVYNKGAAPLKIERITTSCGCTTGEMEETLIPPGGESDLIIRVDPARIPGFFANKVLTVFNNDPTNPHPTINVISHVEPEVALEPETLELGEVELGSVTDAVMRVRQLQEAPVEITAVAPARPLPAIEFDLQDVPEDEWADPEKREWDVVARIPETVPAGRYESWVWLDTNLERNPKLPFKFSARVVGPYELLPHRVSARGIDPGTPSDPVLILQSKLPLSDISVENKNATIEVITEPNEDGRAVTFKLHVPERPGSRAQRDEWTVSFNAGDRAFTETVPVTVVLNRAS